LNAFPTFPSMFPASNLSKKSAKKLKNYFLRSSFILALPTTFFCFASRSSFLLSPGMMLSVLSHLNLGLHAGLLWSVMGSSLQQRLKNYGLVLRKAEPSEEDSELILSYALF
jgi:hypothetical protein